MGSQNNPDDESKYLDRVDRRDLLRGSAVAATAGLAGCGGDGGGGQTTTEATTTATTEDMDEGGEDTTTTTTAEQMAAPLDDTWDVAISPRAPPDKLHWNRYNPKQNARGTNAWDIMAFTHPGTEDRLFAPALLEDFSWDPSGPTLVFKLHDTKWWDGTQVDSQDLWTKAMMEAATNRRAHRVVANEYKQPDARTLRMKFGTSANPQVMQTQAIFRGMDTPYDQADKFFGKKADRVWDAHQGFSNGANQWETEVLKTVAEELTTQRIPQEKAFGNGLFKHTSYSSQQIKAKLHEGHWNSDAWQGVDSVMHYAPKSDQQISLFLGDTTERQGSIPKDLQDEAPDHAVRITGANSTGQGLSWNQTVEPFDNLDVRKGMLFGIDRKRVTENLPSADLWTVDKVITGVSATESLYIQDKHFDAFPRYGGVTGDKARAEEHLQMDDRLSKSNGTWMLNESSWSFTLKEYKSQQVAAAQTIKSIYDDMGISVSVQKIEGGTYWGQMYPGSNFDATVSTVMGWRFYPYNGFNEDVVGIGSLNFARNNAYPGAKPSEKTPPRVKGEIDAPPVGATGQPSGTGIDADYSKTYKPPELLKELLTSSDPERNRELITTIGWIAGTTLPTGYLHYSGSATWLTNDHWNIPPEDSPNREANVRFVQGGYLTPKRKG